LRSLVRRDTVKLGVLKKAAVSFMKIAQKTSDALDKAYCLCWAGRCYEDFGDNRLAMVCYAAAAQINPSETFALERLGDFSFEAADESERYYKQVLEFNPLCSRTYYKLGKLYSTNGDSQKAISKYLGAVEVNNRFVAPMAEAAIECAKVGDKNNMLKYYLLAMANDLYEFEMLEESIEECLC
jgi:tetratricopeptide (TPR) repeat protein